MEGMHALFDAHVSDRKHLSFIYKFYIQAAHFSKFVSHLMIPLG